MSDPELTAVRRPFDAAFSRMRQAGDVDLLRDELSKMLHHMYRLGELGAQCSPAKLAEVVSSACRISSNGSTELARID